MSRREVSDYDDIGTRLLPTADACLQFPQLRGTRGTLVGFGRETRAFIRVKRDDIKTVERYHRKFWRRAQTHAEKERAK